MLKDIPAGETKAYEYMLDNAFFAEIDAPEVQRGKVHAQVEARHKSASYELQIALDGVIYIPCDRCLDDMEHEVAVDEKLYVKIGDEYREESDDTLVIPEPGELNIAWYLYEFIALSIPLKHVHAEGECNEEMSKRLHQMQAHLPEDAYEGAEEPPLYGEGADGEAADEAEKPTDPRWDALKKLKR